MMMRLGGARRYRRREGRVRCAGLSDKAEDGSQKQMCFILVQCLLILFNNMRLLRMPQGWQADRKQI